MLQTNSDSQSASCPPPFHPPPHPGPTGENKKIGRRFFFFELLRSMVLVGQIWLGIEDTKPSKHA